MRKLALEKNKILFCIVIVSIFLIAIGIILLLIFVDKKQNPVKEQTVQQRVFDLLNAKSENPNKIDREMIIKLLNASTTNSKNIQISEQEILNLLNQKQ